MYYSVLDKYEIDLAEALAYGFVINGSILTFRKELSGTEFYIIITISGKEFRVDVFDIETEEEYLPFNVVDNQSGYVNQVREMVDSVINEIIGKCFKIIDTKNLLMKYCTRTFGTVPETPWEDTPDAYTFKTSKRNKWYAVFLTIPYKSLGIYKKGKLDIVNIKLEPERVIELIDIEHYFPAYHMNKKHWLTIVLDKDVNIEQTEELLQCSYALVENIKKKNY